LPAALCLARDHGVQVSALSASPAISDFIASYDEEGLLEIIPLRRPLFAPDSLFRLPSRLAVLLLNYRRIASFRYIATTEVSSAHLRKIPGFSSRMIQLKHGAGDREGGYRSRHDAYDLTLVIGEKDKERLIERALATAENCKVTGYAKFELMAPPQRFFDNDRPVVLYNPHFDRSLSSWINHGPQILRCLESITDFNFIIAPHVKMAAKPGALRSSAPNLHIDPGSRRSIDMSYTNSADIYLGDVSSQVYEFVSRPRPCLFLNLGHIPWQNDPHFTHWRMGQVVEQLMDLPTALRQARALQPQFEPAQRSTLDYSISLSAVPASKRQAEAIVEFIDASEAARKWAGQDAVGGPEPSVEP
jgi:hypothetical protein